MTTNDAFVSPEITPAPNPVDPSVSISPPTDAVAGVPSSIRVFADPGTRWVLQGNSWHGVPAVTFDHTEVTLGVPDGDQFLEGITDYPGGGGTYAETFPSPGVYSVAATCFAGSSQYSAVGRTFTVGTAGPPTFTWTTPADGSTVSVGAGGATVSVQLSASGAQVFPFTVRIDHDGQPPTSDQFNGGSFQKVITIPPTPPGNRTISVTCTDNRGQATTQNHTITVQDGAPPTVAVNPPQPVALTELPQPVTITGTTSGSGVNGVSYVVSNGATGTATDTSTAHDWSTWQFTFDVVTSGSFTFTVTATDVRGGSGSGMSSVQVS